MLGFVLACVKLSETRFLSLTVPTYWGVEAQRPTEVGARPGAQPERQYSRLSAQQAGRLRPTTEPLAWRFPEDPVDPEKKSPVKFKLRQPATTNRVAVRCGESRIQVEVSQDLLGLGKLVKPEEITLGGCSAAEIDNLSHVLVFESELHGCGSKLQV